MLLPVPHGASDKRCVRVLIAVSTARESAIWPSRGEYPAPHLRARYPSFPNVASMYSLALGIGSPQRSVAGAVKWTPDSELGTSPPPPAPRAQGSRLWS